MMENSSPNDLTEERKKYGRLALMELSEIKTSHPHFRLCQIISIASDSKPDIFHVEDKKLYENLKQLKKSLSDES